MSDNKTIPYNEDAEAAVLGCVLIDPDCFPDVLQTLDTRHFYVQRHRWIYEAFKTLHQRGEPQDFLMVTTALDEAGKLESAGGGVYISQLINAVPSAINVRHYAKLVFEQWKRRQAIEIASDVAKMAFNETTDIADTAAFIQARLDDLMHAPAQQTFQSFADLAETLPPITWLWPSWIPRGMISLLGAVPGAGKSLIALDLSRRVIHGEPFPDGSTNPYPDGRNVIYVDAELVPQLINERAKAWKVDTSKLFLMMPNPNDMIDFARQEYRERLRNMVDHLQPGLVVIDSLSSVSSKGENNIEDIRAILSFFNEIANNYQVGLLLVHHLRKRGADAPMELSPDDLRGSSHIIAMARSIMGLSVIQTTAEMDRNGPRKLEILKTNLGRYPDAIGCELLPLHPEGVYLKWDDEAPEPYKEPTLADQAATWLVEMLRDAGEPLPPKEIIELGEDEGFSRATIYRAKSMLNGQIVAVGTRPNTEWQYGL